MRVGRPDATFRLSARHMIRDFRGLLLRERGMSYSNFSRWLGVGCAVLAATLAGTFADPDADVEADDHQPARPTRTLQFILQRRHGFRAGGSGPTASERHIDDYKGKVVIVFSFDPTYIDNAGRGEKEAVGVSTCSATSRSRSSGWSSPGTGTSPSANRCWRTSACRCRCTSTTSGRCASEFLRLLGQLPHDRRHRTHRFLLPHAAGEVDRALQDVKVEIQGKRL